MEHEYSQGYFEPEEYVSDVLDDMGDSLRFMIGTNTANAAGKVPQLQVQVLQDGDNATNFWIDLDKIDEVITALAWAKHRMEEETRGQDSSG